MATAMSRNEQWQMSHDAAQAYEQFVARYILGPWAPLLVDAATIGPGERVLDVACGTGVVARTVAERVGPDGHVVGIDLNPGMIAVARTLSSRGASVEWMERSALDLGLPGDSFDAVLCQQGLQFFPDMALAIREMQRVLRRGGRLALSVWNSVGLYNKAVGDALAQYVGEHVASRFLASRRAPARAELERLAAEAGFANVELRVARIDVRLPKLHGFVLDHLSATPVALEIANAGDETRKRVGATVMQQLSAYADQGGVRYPEETFVLTAIKPRVPQHNARPRHKES
jgi:ubiquinone/menaquinone biosynthesis C-methylase UbiE